MGCLQPTADHCALVCELGGLFVGYVALEHFVGWMGFGVVDDYIMI